MAALTKQTSKVTDLYTEMTMTALVSSHHEILASTSSSYWEEPSVQGPLTATSMPAQEGDIVTIDLRMTPENGYVPEPLFDTSGIVTLVLGWGNYLPGLHELIAGCRVGDSVKNVSIDAGWGDRRKDLLFRVTQSKLDSILSQSPSSSSSLIQVGTTLKLPGGIEVVVSELEEHKSPQERIVVLDANPPLAGTSYACSFTVLEVTSLSQELLEYQHTSSRTQDSKSSLDSPYQVATFALGCFWGAELAFSRLAGVVGTQVGYSQGITEYSPTYEEVCTGKTQHREAVRVVYDTRRVSYLELLQAAVERLDQTTSSLELHKLFQEQQQQRLDDDASIPDMEGNVQYKHGFYFHTEEQRSQVWEFLEQRGNRFGVEVQKISSFFKAEEYHQHYLFKGGQSTKKGSKEMIRCFG